LWLEAWSEFTLSQSGHFSLSQQGVYAVKSDL
jgi:hypothetical protein